MSTRIQDAARRINTHGRRFRNAFLVGLVSFEPFLYGRHREADRRKRYSEHLLSHGFPGSTPGAIEAVFLNMKAKTHVILFDSSAERWRVYESFDSEEVSHEQMVGRASELANEWLGESLPNRIAPPEETHSDV